MSPNVLPILESLFRNNEWTKKLGREGDIEKIMSGRWLPNTPTGQMIYQVYTVRGVPPPREYAEMAYDEWLQKNDEAYMNLMLERRGEGDNETPPTDEPATIMAGEAPIAEPVGNNEAQNRAAETLRQMGFPTWDTSGASPKPNNDIRISHPEGEKQDTAQNANREVDPFIRMLQTALVMRMLGGTGGAFGALALAPILKELFDEMFGRKKRDTGQDSGQPPSTNPQGGSGQPPTANPQGGSGQPVSAEDAKRVALSALRQLGFPVGGTNNAANNSNNETTNEAASNYQSPLFEWANNIFRQYTDPNASPFSGMGQSKPRPQQRRRGGGQQTKKQPPKRR